MSKLNARLYSGAAEAASAALRTLLVYSLGGVAIFAAP